MYIHVREAITALSAVPANFIEKRPERESGYPIRGFADVTDLHALVVSRMRNRLSTRKRRGFPVQKNPIGALPRKNIEH